MKVLVAGAGYVGTASLELLSKRGHEVWGLRRSPSPAQEQIVTGDASTGEGLERLPSDFDEVVISISPDARDDESYERAYPAVARTLSKRFPASRLHLISSTAVYAQDGGAEIIDSSPTAASSFSSQRILEAEKIVLNHSPSSSVIRASGIYGPQRIATISRLAHAELEADERAMWTNRIHRDDLARVIEWLVESKERCGVFLATDPTPSTLREIQDWLRTRPERSLLPSPSGKGRTRSRKSRKMRPQRLQEAGFAFDYESFRAGYEEVLRELAAHPTPP